VVTAALATLDEVGLDGLTMRRLAAHLGVQSPSLYWHVRDKDELLSLIADAICAELQTPNGGLPWEAQLEALAWEYRRVLLAHRDAALVLASTPPVGPNRLRLAEQMLSMLVRAGFQPSVAARAGLLMVDYATNAVIEEGRLGAMPDASSRGSGDAPAVVFATLSPEEFPTLTALSRDLTMADPEARYQFGIEVLLTGLRARLSRPNA
jgi:TetR/AcrR family tetracycline transcriptional repressor